MRLRRDSWAMKTALAGFSAITSGQALATFYCQGQFRDAHTGATVDLFAMCSTFSYTDPEANMVAKAGYAVIGDLHQVIPAVLEEVRRRKS